MKDERPVGDLDPKDRLENYAAKAVGQRLDRLVYDMDQVTRAADAEPVHDLRVAVRRLNSALGVFKGQFPKKASSSIRKRLSQLRQAAGDVRDRDISLRLTAGELGAAEPLVERLNRERKKAASRLQKKVRKVLRKSPGSAWRKELRLPPFSRANGASGPRAATFAAATLPDAARTFFLAGRAAAEQGPPIEQGPPGVPLHPLRIQGKKLRYCLELFAPCYGPEVNELIDTLKKVQDYLGDINDCKAAAPLLTEGASKQDSARIRESLKARDQELFDEFRRYWTETVDAPGELETWLLTLGRGA